MAAEDEIGKENIDRAIDELMTLQHVAQHAPVHELLHDLVAMLNDLGHVLDQFNGLSDAEPCSSGCAPADIQDELVKVVKLSTHIAIYTLGICHRSPDGFYIGLLPSPADLN